MVERNGNYELLDKTSMNGCADLVIAKFLSTVVDQMPRSVAALGSRGRRFDSHGAHTLLTSPKNTFGITRNPWGTILDLRPSSYPKWTKTLH